MAASQILTMPSAFAARAGHDQREVLLRARAIENAAYVTAYGRSVVIDPWGTIVRRPEGVCLSRLAARALTNQMDAGDGLSVERLEGPLNLTY